MNWASFAAGLIFAAGVAAAARHVWHVSPWLILLAALLLVALRYRSLALVLELFFIDCLDKMPFGGDPVRHATMVAAVLLLMGYGSSRLMRALVLPASAGWFVVTG